MSEVVDEVAQRGPRGVPREAGGCSVAKACDQVSPSLNPLAPSFVPSLSVPSFHAKPTNHSSKPTSTLPGLLGLHALIRQSGRPNYVGCRQPVPTRLNIPAWKSRLEGYEDSDLCQLLEFGFPIGYQGISLPEPSQANHSGARLFPDAVRKYIDREVGFGATLGPFLENPLCCPLSVSPINTVPKSDSEDRRVIIDLSFPRDASVNSGIDKDRYLDVDVDLHYPTVDSLVSHILHVGKGCALFKCDLSRAYRQFHVDPGDIHLLGFKWNKNLYIDCVLPFGLRSAAQICQRVTDAVTYISSKSEGKSLMCNYLDDFAGVCYQEEAVESFGKFRVLLQELGLDESTSKACAPSSIMTFIGVKFDTNTLLLEVTPQKMQEARSEVENWLGRQRSTKKQLQSLIGKLQFIAKCVRSGRIFISRLLDSLTGLKEGESFRIPVEFKKDLLWWKRFASEFNGVIMMGETRWTNPDELIATDACLTGLGGICSGGEYSSFFHCSVPSFLALAHIGVLELVAVVIAIKLWGTQCSGKRILIQCDNLSTVGIMNSGKSKDALMLVWLRELLYVASKAQIQIHAIHLEGISNRLPDMLSRWSHKPSSVAFQQAINDRTFLESEVTNRLFELQHTW